ncbi:MAG: AMP-binding protein [Azoarcus sp.]|jgi:3-hydroxymyristoyl/3-hydroxydecanoyl-(acyl carrier protein) dehydratase|nr:AMP-binding protein [Azoarcus sp.]
MPESAGFLARGLARHWPLPESARPVVWRAGQPVGRAAFLRDLDAARRCLLAGSAPGEMAGRPCVALFDGDAYRFIVRLLAGWSLGLTIVLPGDDLPATRQALVMPWIGNIPLETPAERIVPAHAHGIDDVDYACPGLVSFTSGSTGKPSFIERNPEQLRAEAAMLEATFGGDLPPDTRFVCSVPHQHMFGLPFFILWPLCAARPIVVEKLRYPEDLERLPAADYVFVSAPTFLKHLPETPEAHRAPRWRLAVSAGSPLAAEVAARSEAFLQAPVFEIYGSTEAGASAFRRGSAPWQAMPGVRFQVEESTSRLLIHSPLLSEAERESGFLSGDLARIDEHGLTLLGRVDCVVKIGEKRISLTQVEEALARLPGVERARAVPLPHARESGRLILGAVLVLTPEGRARLAAEKKTRFDASLRDGLRAWLDPLAWPRRWRYVEAFPCNEMGKTLRRDLERLFVPLLPHARLLAQDREDDGRTQAGAAANAGSAAPRKALLQLALPHDLAWFEGHFPDLPVLPGVVQVDWAAHFAHFYFGFDAMRCDIAELKFQNLIRPGDTLRLELTLKRGGKELEFGYTLDGKICSRGAFVPRKAAEAAVPA